MVILTLMDEHLVILTLMDGHYGDSYINGWAFC